MTKFEPMMRKFMPAQEAAVIRAGLRGEEAKHFEETLTRIEGTINGMPKTYEQDGKGDEAIAYLHYFRGSGDWWITEKDMEDEQLQAFGLADLGYGAELGYISIAELVENGVELDLYFTPKTLREIKAKRP